MVFIENFRFLCKYLSRLGEYGVIRNKCSFRKYFCSEVEEVLQERIKMNKWKEEGWYL